MSLLEVFHFPCIRLYYFLAPGDSGLSAVIRLDESTFWNDKLGGIVLAKTDTKQRQRMVRDSTGRTLRIISFPLPSQQ